MNLDVLRAGLVRAHARAIESMQLQSRTADFVCRRVQGDRIAMIAAGKGAVAMAAGALQALGSRVSEGLVVCPDTGSAGSFPSFVRVLRAPHPLPDQRSVDAAEACLALAARTTAEHMLLVLISGGASSLLCAPPAEMKLSEKLDLVASLLRSGATIGEVNTVRRHLSRIKGGRLALASPANVVCGIASDVVAGACHDVGSGPACADPTSLEEACDVAMRTLGREAAQRVRPWMSDGLRPGGVDSSRVFAEILVRPEDFGARIAGLLSEDGFTVSSEVIERCTVEELAHHLVATSQAISAESARVITCEPVIRLRANAGRGGRAGWVALRVLLDPALGEQAAVLCGASDGMDGSSGSGGACVSRDVAAGYDRGAMQRALDEFRDADVHEEIGTRLGGGATGLNLCDAYVCARGRT